MKIILCVCVWRGRGGLRRESNNLLINNYIFVLTVSTYSYQKVSLWIQINNLSRQSVS